MKKLIILFLTIAVLSGCGSFQSIKYLDSDKIDIEDGFNSVLILHLTIKDKSSFLLTLGNISLWDRYIGKTKKENRLSQYIIRPNWQWEKSSDEHAFTKKISLQTLGGSHKILALSFQNSSKIYSFKTRIEYDVPDGEIAYLGNLILTVDGHNNYTYKITKNMNNSEEVLGAFSRNFPKLYNKFNRKYALVNSRKVND